MTDKFKTDYEINWCPGCGNFGILQSLKNAFIKMKLTGSDVLMVYGIGCHGHMVNFLKTYGFEGIHGRAIPVAVGAKIANQKLEVIALAGDGDQLGEGINHLIHAAKRNHNITCVINDNRIYALTVGEFSPTSDKKMITKTTPYDKGTEPLNPCALAVVSGASFVARGFAGDIEHLTKILTAAIRHKGFSLVHILQPCVTFNYLNTYDWYRERVYKLEKSCKHKSLALKKCVIKDKIPIGVIYKVKRPVFEDNVPDLVSQDIKDVKIKKLLSEFI